MLSRLLPQLINGRQVCPEAVQDDPRHHRATHSIVSRELALTYPTSNPPLSSLNNHGIGEFRFWVRLTYGVPRRVVGMSSLTGSVLTVVAGRAKEKMTRVATGRIVAVMANKKGLRVLSGRDKPCSSMRPPVSLSTDRGCQGEPAVSASRPCTDPGPAPVEASALIDLQPKTINLFWGKLIAHLGVSPTQTSRGAMPRAVPAAPGLLHVSIIPDFRVVMGFLEV